MCWITDKRRRHRPVPPVTPPFLFPGFVPKRFRRTREQRRAGPTPALAKHRLSTPLLRQIVSGQLGDAYYLRLRKLSKNSWRKPTRICSSSGERTTNTLWQLSPQKRSHPRSHFITTDPVLASPCQRLRPRSEREKLIPSRIKAPVTDSDQVSVQGQR